MSQVKTKVSKSVEIDRNELARLRRIESAAKMVMTSWDARTLEEEREAESETVGTYWFPHASMVASKFIHELRHALGWKRSDSERYIKEMGQKNL